eukprot:767700-Hanusia_phi.AAC.7
MEGGGGSGGVAREEGREAGSRWRRKGGRKTERDDIVSLTRVYLLTDGNENTTGTRLTASGADTIERDYRGALQETAGKHLGLRRLAQPGAFGSRLLKLWKLTRSQMLRAISYMELSTNTVFTLEFVRKGVNQQNE